MAEEMGRFEEFAEVMKDYIHQKIEEELLASASRDGPGIGWVIDQGKIVQTAWDNVIRVARNLDKGVADENDGDSEQETDSGVQEV